jgi:hypothetical protein
MRSRILLSAGLLAGLLGLGVEILGAQVVGRSSRAEIPSTAPMAVPFGPGEDLRYDVRLGFLGRKGRGHMKILGIDSVRDRTTYHVEMAIRGGLIWDQVRDQYDSWLDVTNLVTLRSIQDIKELQYERYRHFEIFPEEMRFERRDKVESGPIPTSLPLDDVSFFYFVRTLPLEVGQEYTFNRYYRENGNPVVLQVLRRDTVEVPAGTFPTIVVKPLIQTSGLFGEGGEAELYFSDDDRRLLVLMRSKIPIIGFLSLHLRRVTEGEPLAQAGSRNADEVMERLNLPEPRSFNASGVSAIGSGGDR